MQAPREVCTYLKMYAVPLIQWNVWPLTSCDCQSLSAPSLLPYFWVPAFLLASSFFFIILQFVNFVERFQGFQYHVTLVCEDAKSWKNQAEDNDLELFGGTVESEALDILGGQIVITISQHLFPILSYILHSTQRSLFYPHHVKSEHIETYYSMLYVDFVKNYAKTHMG